MSKKSGEFEFKLGRSGLTFFIFVIAVVLLFSFVSGVMVGKNIESYPEKIARGIPGAIRKTITKSMDIEPDTAGRDITPDAIQKDVPPDTPAGEEKVEFTFYDTLKQTGETVKETFTEKKVTAPDTSSYAPPEKKQAGGLYVIQVASFRGKDMTGALTEKLSHMGYAPRVDEVTLKTSGKWFRVKVHGFATYDEAKTAASLLEKKVRGITCLIIKNRKSE
ncbi:MAG: SPOR domain-containing protein [Deltaproteobacteria bacterium]|nr:SPOR domain-containing protein [Deltaproteobacteria bacterium]